MSESKPLSDVGTQALVAETSNREWKNCLVGTQISPSCTCEATSSVSALAAVDPSC